MNLANEQCEPCHGGIPSLTPDEQKELQNGIPTWEIIYDHHLRKEFTFPDFAKALAFVNAVGALAEDVGHHPDIELSWGKVVVSVWTHKIDGLHKADFVFAAKIDAL